MHIQQRSSQLNYTKKHSSTTTSNRLDQITRCLQQRSYTSISISTEAIKYFDKAIELDANYVIAYNNKGFVLNNLNQHEEAIKYYDKAIELDQITPVLTTTKVLY